MGRTGTTTLRKVLHLRHDRASRARPKAGMRVLRGLSPNRVLSSAFSPRRRAVPRPRLGDASHRDRDRGHHSHTRGQSRKSLQRSYRDENTYYEDEDNILELTDNEAEGHDDDFLWDEERTLFSDLMGEVNFKDDGSEDWTDLLESLQIAFDEDCVELKKDIAQAFVPAVNRAKTCYRMFDEQDEAYGKGVLMLNTTLKDYEIMSVATEDKLKEAHSLAQNKIETLLKQLGESYAQRDRLWIAIQEEFNKYVDPVTDLLKKTPANIERVIAGLDKVRARAVEKDEGNSTMYSEQMIKSLLKGF
ncbi:hypothetical protein AX14_001665 [Amanita brunnescens Koide BX004]|nr:hypothetical protein AX14_001665 [Amanita brunnescens Koide BX004]